MSKFEKPNNNPDELIRFKFPLEIGALATPVVLEKIKEFARLGNVELSYEKEGGHLTEKFKFELRGRREDIDNVVKGINEIIRVTQEN